MNNNKLALLQFLSEKIQQQIVDVKTEINSIVQEIGNETKSSAGDKFETAREMMNQERGRMEERAQHLKEQLRAINEMKHKTPDKSVNFGSFVETSAGTFLFGLALGKVEFENRQYFVLSLNSPVGKQFSQKKEGDSVSFNTENYNILTIY